MPWYQIIQIPSTWYVTTYRAPQNHGQLHARQATGSLAQIEGEAWTRPTESAARWSRERPSSFHPPSALLHPGGLIESSSKATAHTMNHHLSGNLDLSIIYLHGVLIQEMLRLLTTVQSSTQHSLPLHSSFSSNIALPRQAQPYACSSIRKWSGARYHFHVTRIHAFSVCTLCSNVVVVVLSFIHHHNAFRGHRTGSNNSGVEDYRRRKIIIL